MLCFLKNSRYFYSLNETKDFVTKSLQNYYGLEQRDTLEEYELIRYQDDGVSKVLPVTLPYSTLSSPPPLSSPPVSLVKSWSLAISLKKIYIENFFIRNYFKKDLLNFFIRYDTAIIKQSSSYFFEKISSSVCFCKLSMKLARAVSSSSSSFTFDHLKSITFSSFQDLRFDQ